VAAATAVSARPIAPSNDVVPRSHNRSTTAAGTRDTAAGAGAASRA
jgi:hypothetical protein